MRYCCFNDSYLKEQYAIFLSMIHTSSYTRDRKQSGITISMIHTSPRTWQNLIKYRKYVYSGTIFLNNQCQKAIDTSVLRTHKQKWKQMILNIIDPSSEWYWWIKIPRIHMHNKSEDTTTKILARILCDEISWGMVSNILWKIVRMNIYKNQVSI